MKSFAMKILVFSGCLIIAISSYEQGQDGKLSNSGDKQEMKDINGNGIQFKGDNNKVIATVNKITKVYPKESKPTFSIIKISVNTKCEVSEDGSVKGIAEVGKPLSVRLTKGQHRLLIKGVYLENYAKEANVTVSNDMIGTERYADIIFRIGEFLKIIYIQNHSPYSKGLVNILTNEVVVDCIYDEIFLFADGMAVVYKDGKYGCINEAGRLVIPNVYERVSDFNNGIGQVELNGKKLTVDRDGNPSAIPYKPAAPVWRHEFEKSWKNGLVGLINKNNEWVVLPDYTAIIQSKKTGIIKVGKGGQNVSILGVDDPDESQTCTDCKWGLLKSNGSLLLPAVYDEILYKSQPQTVTNAFSVMVKRGDEWSIIKLIDRQLYSADKFNDAMETGNRQIIVERSKKFGLLGTEYKPVIHIEYKDIYLINDTSGKSTSSYYYGVVDNNDKIALFDEAGRQLTKFEFDRISSYITNRLMHIEKGSWAGYMNEKGEVVTPFNYDTIASGQRDESAAYYKNIKVKKDGKYELIDRTGKLLTNFHADMILSGHLTPRSYFIHDYYEDQRGVIIKDNLYWMIDQDGKLLTSKGYQFIGGFHDGRKAAVVLSNGKCGLIDRNGKIILQPDQYEFGQDWDGRLFRMDIDDNYMYIDDQGNCIAGCKVPKRRQK